jgi:hypothetical protein
VHEDGLDVRGIDGKQPFHPDAVGDFADRKGGGEARSLALDDVSLEALDTFLVAFDDLIVHGNIISSLEGRELLFGGQLLVDKSGGVHNHKFEECKGK